MITSSAEEGMLISFALSILVDSRLFSSEDCDSSWWFSLPSESNNESSESNTVVIKVMDEYLLPSDCQWRGEEVLWSLGYNCGQEVQQVEEVAGEEVA